MTAEEARALSDPIRLGDMHRAMHAFYALTYDTIRSAASQGRTAIRVAGHDIRDHNGIDHFLKRGFRVKPVQTVGFSEEKGPNYTTTEYEISW